MDVRKWYLGFAETEASGSSPTYERLAREVADSPTMIGLLEQLPPVKRQPNLLFAAARFEGVSRDDSRPFVEQVASEWDRVSAVMRSRATSTMLRGDLVDTIHEALSLVPDDVTPVVFHSAVLNYVAPATRVRFASQLAEHPDAVWNSNEGSGIVDGLTTDLRPPAHATSAAYFVVGRGETTTVGISDPHGSWITWSA